MNNITITINDSLYEQIMRRSIAQNSTPEEFIQDMLIHAFQAAEVSVEDASDYVLKKNNELYMRLA